MQQVRPPPTIHTRRRCDPTSCLLCTIQSAFLAFLRACVCRSTVDLVCKELGFTSGKAYTYGKNSALAELPIVAGYRECSGGEHSLFDCPYAGNPSDAKGVKGVDASCSHSIDQGAICSDERTTQKVSPGLATCSGAKIGGSLTDKVDQKKFPVVFGCIDYYTAQCHYDVTHAKVGGCETCASYTRALRHFAKCVQTTSSGMTGYCHGALSTAAKLANHDVCQNALRRQIGFHIRIPFVVNTAGQYQFRMHADFGLGSFIGVDGAEHTPGNHWGHLQLEPKKLNKGDHEFEVLGFEDCCDGHSELEVHLPCDNFAAPWRVVVSGPSDCMTCDVKSARACAANTRSAGYCGLSGNGRPISVGDHPGNRPIGSTDNHCVNQGNTGRKGGGNAGGKGNGEHLKPGKQASFNLQVCIDRQDSIFFQDNRIWIQYGGTGKAAGAQRSCPASVRGKAYVDKQVWDISKLKMCKNGKNCPAVQLVAPKNKFVMPTGCKEMVTRVVKNSNKFKGVNRGTVSVPVQPSSSNGWRGEVQLSDQAGGAMLYDIKVTVTCMGSAPDPGVRLACTHSAGKCHQGRLEVRNPATKKWGTVCGQ